MKITDSYKKIAHAHHITVAQLKAANHIKDNVLHAGQKLIIPMSKTAVAKNEPMKNEPTPESAPMFASTASLSAEPALAPAPMLHHHFYTVAKGDTLRKLAHRFKTTPGAIMDANNLSDSKLVVGEKLRIPAKEMRATAATVAQPAPAAVQPRQVETQPAPIVQPAPIEPPASTPDSAPQATPPSSPELANLTF
ncbi:MAG: LysM peptidoglycan-binding domain-containing protein [Verrucomicrobiota bacterium]